MDPTAIALTATVIGVGLSALGLAWRVSTKFLDGQRQQLEQTTRTAADLHHVKESLDRMSTTWSDHERQVRAYMIRTDKRLDHVEWKIGVERSETK